MAGKEKEKEKEKEKKRILFDLKALIAINIAVFFAALSISLGATPVVIQYFGLEHLFYTPDYDVPWVKNLEKDFQRQIANQEEFPTTAEMKMMWQTPILHVNVAVMIGSVDVPKFNARLSVAVLTEYRNLLKKNGVLLAKDGTQVNDANQVFFEWQSKGGWRNLRAYEEIRLLEDFIQAGVDKYLKAIGKSPEFIKARSSKLEIWATVHEAGVSHLAHVHPNSLVSGVYYVKMPEQAGNIVFEDPRGPLPPFDNKLTIKPFIGDLVMFPSWLVHLVSPTFGQEERISIAFNVPGDWYDTVSISEWFALAE